MRRRDFLSTGLAPAVALWPLAAAAQQPREMPRIGVLLPAASDDAEYQAGLTAFEQGLQQLGWTDGRNVRIDTRWAGVDADAIRRQAAELAALAPDVILAHANAAVGALRRVTRTVPIVFADILDPVAGGHVESLARPGGNVTGFMGFEFNFSAKWLELLKEVAPGVTRAAVLRDTAVGSGTSQFAVIHAVAPLLRMEVNPVNMPDASEIERAVAAGGSAQRHRDFIVTLAARHKLPTVYFERSFVAAGDLISYGRS